MLDVNVCIPHQTCAQYPLLYRGLWFTRESIHETSCLSCITGYLASHLLLLCGNLMQNSSCSAAAQALQGVLLKRIFAFTHLRDPLASFLPPPALCCVLCASGALTLVYRRRGAQQSQRPPHQTNSKFSPQLKSWKHPFQLRAKGVPL